MSALVNSPGLRGILARDLSKDLVLRLQSAVKGLDAIPGSENDPYLQAAQESVRDALDHLQAYGQQA